MPDALRHPRSWVRPLAVAITLAGCSDNPVLPPPTGPVTQQQITLYALSNTPVGTPSGYSLLLLIETRTDETNEFDFAFEIGVDSALGVGRTGDTVAVLLPRGAMGFAPDPGLQLSSAPFDSIMLAPLGGYEKERPVPIQTGSVLIAASRVQTCNFGVVRPRFAKLRVESVDFIQRKAIIFLRIDPNCGYRFLGEGFPTQ